MTEVNQRIEMLKNLIAGGFGGVCLVIAGHPLDTVKVRLQTMPIPGPGSVAIYNGTFDCIKKTFHNEGLRGFFKGMATPFFGIIPIYALTFFGYGLGKSLQNPHGPNGEFSKMQIFNAGMLSAVFTTVIAAPGERIKCLLQVQANTKSQKTLYKGPLDCGVKLYRSGGLRSLFRGTSVTLLRDAPGNGVYFIVYETIKKYFESSTTLPNGQVITKQNPLGTLFAGGMAGILFWVVAIPPDVMKSRLQTAPESEYPRGIRDVCRKIIKNEGIGAFYKGASAVFLRAFPANAACFGGYEAAMFMINHFI